MDPNAKVIPVHLYPMGFIEGFTRFGAPLDALLRGTGIDRRMLDSGNGRISYAQQGRLIRNGVALCQTPGLGLLIGMHWEWGYHGTVGYVVHCSPSLREAAEAFLRYRMIAQPLYVEEPGRPLGFVDRDDTYVYPIRCFLCRDADEELRRFELEFRLATTLRFWDACGNKSVPDPSVHVRLACPEPPYVELFERLPCTSLTFNAEADLVSAHKSFRNEPFRQFRRPQFERLLAQCEAELRQAGLQQSFADQVRVFVGNHFSRQLPLVGTVRTRLSPASVEEAAHAFRMTPRAFARRLAMEGTTFRKIVHQVKIEFTLHQLRLSRLTVEEIAELTGFSCASSMRRAIKSALGQPLSVARSGRA